MILYVLMLALIIVVFNLTVPLLAGLYIVSELGGNSFQTSYGVTFFCLGNIVGLPFGNPAHTQLGPISLFVLCLILMGFCSWHCAVATNYFSFVLFRFFEGVASGPLLILVSYTLIPLLAPEKDPRFVFSLFLATFTFIPSFSGAYGYWIAYYYTWRFPFYSNILICLFLITYVGFGYRKYNDQPRSENVHFDAIGYLYYVISIVFIGTVLTVGQELDWFRSDLIIFLTIVGSISLVFFILRSLSVQYPILELRLLKQFYFSFGLLHVAILFATYFGMVILLGLWLKLYVNYTPNWIALIIGTMALGTWVPIAINYLAKDTRKPLAVALVFLALSSFYTTYFNVDIDFNRLAFSRILAGVGLALFLQPLFRLSTKTILPTHLPDALSFFHLARLLGSGLGASLFVILWHRRQVFFQSRLGSRLTDFSEITTQFFERAKLHYLQGKQALAQLDFYLERQATALALDDCFFLMGWIIVALIIFVTFTFLFVSRPILYDKPSVEKSETHPPPPN